MQILIIKTFLKLQMVAEALLGHNTSSDSTTPFHVGSSLIFWDCLCCERGLAVAPDELCQTRPQLYNIDLPILTNLAVIAVVHDNSSDCNWTVDRILTQA